VDVERAARRYAETLREAWTVRDVEPFTALFAGNAVFRGPFSEPESAAAHMREALLLGEGKAEVWVGEPLVGGDRAALEWWGVVDVDGTTYSFGGTAWVRFDQDGTVIEENDYWHSAPRRAEPWPGWGRNTID
jgi:hypothetical protein